MKRLRFRELLLVSRKEKAARRVVLHPRVTVVKGENDVGKSSFIKSIYWSLGALPKLHSGWEDANTKSVLTFSVGKRCFRMLRDGGSFTLFDEESAPVKRFTRISAELTPFLADLLDFRLTLPTRKGEPVVPPPAFLFLPYYVDQDVGWQKNWASFTKLEQFADWKKDVAEYHVGIRPNEYYTAKGKMRASQEAMKEPQQKYDMLKGILKNLNSRMQSVDFSIDLDRYGEELGELLVACEMLRKQEQAYKERLVKAHNVKTTIETQIQIARHALSEIRDDFRFVGEKLPNDYVECPICGASYDNDFASRYEIARDEDRCQELLSELANELSEVKTKIKGVNEQYAEGKAKAEEVSALLSRKKEEVKLRDVIESEGHHQVRGILTTESQAISEELQVLRGQIEDLKATMKTYEDRGRRKRITDQYLKLMKSHLCELEVHALLEKSYKRVDATIKESGSDLPRALLAYYFSILSVMDEHSSAARCPIVIDAPNQQDQDLANLKKMLQFVSKHRPKNAQLVLGLVDDCGVDFGGSVVEFEDKYRLLSSRFYDEAMSELSPLLDASFSFGQRTSE